MEIFGSDGWLRAVLAAADVLPEVRGCSATIRMEVSGGPDGTCRFGLVLSDGRLAELIAGRPADPDCTVSTNEADARRILSGELDPAVAYMQGRLKIEGAYERVLFGLRPAAGGEAFSSFAAQVIALTGWVRA